MLKIPTGSRRTRCLFCKCGRGFQLRTTKNKLSPVSGQNWTWTRGPLKYKSSALTAWSGWVNDQNEPTELKKQNKTRKNKKEKLTTAVRSKLTLSGHIQVLTFTIQSFSKCWIPSLVKYPAPLISYTLKQTERQKGNMDTVFHYWYCDIVKHCSQKNSATFMQLEFC